MSVQKYLHSLESYLRFADEDDIMLIESTLDKLIDREISMVESKIGRYDQMLGKFVQKYNMNFDEFKKRFEKGEIEEDMDYLEWSSIVDAKEHCQEKIKALKRVPKPMPSPMIG